MYRIRADCVVVWQDVATPPSFLTLKSFYDDASVPYDILSVTFFLFLEGLRCLTLPRQTNRRWTDGSSPDDGLELDLSFTVVQLDKQPTADLLFPHIEPVTFWRHRLTTGGFFFFFFLNVIFLGCFWSINQHRTRNRWFFFCFFNEMLKLKSEQCLYLKWPCFVLWAFFVKFND